MKKSTKNQNQVEKKTPEFDPYPKPDNGMFDNMVRSRFWKNRMNKCYSVCPSKYVFI